MVASGICRRLHLVQNWQAYRKREVVMRALNVVVMALIWTVAISLLVCGVVCKCCAQYDERTALALVQCIRAECDRCDRHPDEQAAIAWALKKQAKERGISLLRQIRYYCAMFNKHRDRAVAIFNSTFERPQWGDVGWWRRMHSWAFDFLEGRIPDPVEKAMYFGGEMDVPSSRLIEVKRYCNKRGELCNIFYAYRS